MIIALIGYGRMGKAIENIVLNRQHNLLYKTKNCPSYKDIKNVEVAIEFSQPEFAFLNIKICLQEKISVVSGTTGWLFKIEEIKKNCLKQSGTFLYASNFSIGVNLFFEINKKFAKLIKPYKKEYEVDIKEIHHLNKKDSPSGTAIFLAKNISNQWGLDFVNKKKIFITSKRYKNILGVHIIKYQSLIDCIIFKHIAHNRGGFALGAVIATEWICYRKGIFSLKEILKI